MLKDRSNKLAQGIENKDITKPFRLYSPQVDKVIEAENREEWEKKVQELLHTNSNE